LSIKSQKHLKFLEKKEVSWKFKCPKTAIVSL
jgi:hypothetical protein